MKYYEKLGLTLRLVSSLQLSSLLCWSSFFLRWVCLTRARLLHYLSGLVATVDFFASSWPRTHQSFLATFPYSLSSDELLLLLLHFLQLLSLYGFLGVFLILTYEIKWTILVARNHPIINNPRTWICRNIIINIAVIISKIHIFLILGFQARNPTGNPSEIKNYQMGWVGREIG